MPVNTSYLGQGRGPIGLTSQFTVSGLTIPCQPSNTSEVQFAVPTRLQQVNKSSWVTGDIVLMAPLVSTVSAGLTWNSYVSSAGTVVIRVANASASTATIAASVVWNVIGFAALP